MEHNKNSEHQRQADQERWRFWDRILFLGFFNDQQRAKKATDKEFYHILLGWLIPFIVGGIIYTLVWMVLQAK